MAAGAQRARTPARCGRLTRVHVVIMGCGRVGSTLAGNARPAGALGRRHRPGGRGLPPAARRVPRAHRHRGRLRPRGPRPRPASSEAAAFAAVSSGDNSNILAARVARETFGVENVVARIYDPKRAEVYQRLGIPTVATVRLDRRPDDAPAAAVGRRRRSGATRAARSGSPRCTSTRPGSGSPCSDLETARAVPGRDPHPARRRDAARPGDRAPGGRPRARAGARRRRSTSVEPILGRPPPRGER